MSYIQGVAGGTRYIGATYNLTPKRVEILWVLLSLLIEAGWQIRASADGLSTVSSSSASALTNNNTTDSTNYESNDGSTWAKIAGSIANDKSYFIASPPSGSSVQGYLCVQLISAASNSISLRMKFSAGGFATASSATQTPAPTTGGDEVYILGGGTNASPTGTSISWVDGNQRFNVVCDNASATPRFWLAGWNNTSDTQVLGLVWDFLSDLLPTSDTFPYVVGACPGNFDTLLGDAGNIDTTGYAAATRFGASGTTKVALVRSFFTNGTSLHNAVGVNSINSKEDVDYVRWARPSAAGGARGRKGYSTMIREPSTARSFADNMTTTITREFVYVGGYWLPWAVTGTAAVR